MLRRLGEKASNFVLTAVWVPDDDGTARGQLGPTGAYVCERREEFLDACRSVDLALVSGKTDALDRATALALVDLALDEVTVHGTEAFLLEGAAATHLGPDRQLTDRVAAALEQDSGSRWLKRAIDVAGSAFALLVLAPLMLLIWAAVRLDSPGPALFRQERLGQGRRPFTCLKFRSMREDADRGTTPFWAEENDPRVTRIGRFLRRSRLDELPQFINVLRGEMSLVGPRPIRAYFADQLAEIVPFYDLRFLDKPGITGWAQVQFKYASSMADQVRKFTYDFYYVKNRSFWLDLRIMLKTVKIAVMMKGT